MQPQHAQDWHRRGGGGLVAMSSHAAANLSNWLHCLLPSHVNCRLSGSDCVPAAQPSDAVPQMADARHLHETSFLPEDHEKNGSPFIFQRVLRRAAGNQRQNICCLSRDKLMTPSW